MKRLIPTLRVTLVGTMAPAQTPFLINTFTDPTPADGDIFSAGMAALGSDRVLVGAPYDDTTATNAGAVYLFHTNGTMLTTFTNPNPASTYYAQYLGQQFGGTIATLGSDRVLISSVRDQKVYLFNTNGTLLMTITNPTPVTAAFRSPAIAKCFECGSPQSQFPRRNGISLSSLQQLFSKPVARLGGGKRLGPVTRQPWQSATRQISPRQT